MELYLVILVILIVLAVTDLIVGVSNDAVNFLNSAIGSKAAPRWIILTVASAGILMGTTFSTGMMEVARKGIFNPESFLLPEIMIIFLAVMITDVLLLDLFNTFGLPTSTTVSIVFELLGAAVAMAIIKIMHSAETILDLYHYINSEKALLIISGILLSIVISFSVGAIVQFITRMIFTFDYEKRLKKYGAIWGAFALTGITFFILIKGAKHSSFMSKEIVTWISVNTWNILIYGTIIWGVILQILLSFTRINILKIIILVGTFALALAFAANDLVNFIGVPLAGLTSYNLGVNATGNPMEMLMTELTKPVQTSTLLLLLAGLIMALTLFFSKKANSVTKTEINLSRQGEGFERFESSLLARKLVRGTMFFGRGIEIIVPEKVRTAIKGRFKNSQANIKTADGDESSFDLIRASVNLMVASILISFATSLKLPLSTTYVTFMVAMGTSLSDKAWGRESAVYRITGVITVVGGWFFTAISAFTGAAIIAFLLYFGEMYAIVLMSLLVVYLLVKTQIFHKNKELEDDNLIAEEVTTELGALVSSMKKSKKLITSIKETIVESLSALSEEDIDKLSKLKKEIKNQKKILNQNNVSIIDLIKLQGHDNTKQERRYGKLIASLQMLQKNSSNIWLSSFSHIDNNHKTPDLALMSDLKEIVAKLSSRIKIAAELLTNVEVKDCDLFDNASKEFDETMKQFDKKQIQRMKESSGSTRNNFLFLDLFSYLENISHHLNQLVVLYCKNYNHLK
ncbi:MAG: inorganic phosphate transporter [Bacteroidetes bacterium]|nr:inorganic phosphate transporter [Bacteroidota bacterium]MBU1113839.1 inorganic phosphate transporter [Bacteroidota bacterium]MBU1798203.1 inorganic phosphate transporter [Bacteroidota bacterium]